MKRKIFILGQLLLFLLISCIALGIIICFPNPPSYIRPLINTYRIKLVEQGPQQKIDQRFLAWFNRDPERHVPKEDNIIVSPADGVLEHIIKKEKSIHLVIEMRYTDIHVQRVPITGKLLSIDGGGEKLQEGFNVMDYQLDKMMPFQKITTFDTKIGIVKVHQITSFFAKRITVFLVKGHEYAIGERLGNVLAGSTVVLELPIHVKIVVKKNDELLGGETIVARYERRKTL
jgi:phosphatidylserine decarboxylase